MSMPVSGVLWGCRCNARADERGRNEKVVCPHTSSGSMGGGRSGIMTDPPLIVVVAAMYWWFPRGASGVRGRRGRRALVMLLLPIGVSSTSCPPCWCGGVGGNDTDWRFPCNNMVNGDVEWRLCVIVGLQWQMQQTKHSVRYHC